MIPKDFHASTDLFSVPRVGVGIMVLKGNQVLLGKRKGSHATGEYSFCGGHLEYREGFVECAQREAREECGIEIHNVHFQMVANIDTYAPKHYVQIGLVAHWKAGTPSVLEPHKCESWAWYPLDNLPQPISHMALQIFESYKTNQNFIDKK